MVMKVNTQYSRPISHPVYLAGIDSATGAQKFRISLLDTQCYPPPPDPNAFYNSLCSSHYEGPIIAGDGYAYVAIMLIDRINGMSIVVVRADTSGGNVVIPVKQW